MVEGPRELGIDAVVEVKGGELSSYDMVVEATGASQATRGLWSSSGLAG